MMIHQPSPVEKQNTGFTLIELLVAMTVFAVMSAMAYGGLSNVIDNSEHSTVALERLHKVQRAIFTISRDFTQIVQRSVRDEYGNNQPYLSAGNNIDYLAEFTRSGRRNPAQLLRSHMQRVAYKLEENTLVRIFWPQLDRAQGIEPYETILLENVSAVEIRFLDQKGDWHQTWPLQVETAEFNPATIEDLAGIEFKLDLSDWGEIVRLYKVGG